MPFWSRSVIFRDWPLLAITLLKNAGMLLREVGQHLWPPERKKTDENGLEYKMHPMYGRIQDHPLYAMLCNSHESEGLCTAYTGLHLQMLHARWITACEAARMSGKNPIELLTEGSIPGLQREYAYACALTARHLSNAAYEDLIRFLRPDCRPHRFRRLLGKKVELPDGEHYDYSYKMIRRCCLRSGGSVSNRQGGHGFVRLRIPHEREFVDYGCGRLGMWLPKDDEGENTGEILYEANPALQKPLMAAALELGLSPLELVGGDATVREKVHGAKNTGEAAAVSRSASRTLEIDKSHFPFAKGHLRLEQFRRRILPALIEAEKDPDIGNADLLVACIVAALIDSGRPVEHLPCLHAGRRAETEFSYRPGLPGESGRWFWSAIQPDYRSVITVPQEMAQPRSNYLGFAASPLAAKIMSKFSSRAGIPSGILFRAKADVKSLANAWIKKHDPSGQATLHNLSQLRGEILNRLTGGESAVVSLVLGQREPQVSTELHYAILGLEEADALWAESSRILWSTDPRTGIPRDFRTKKSIEGCKIIGIRAFPRLAWVRQVIGMLQAACKVFSTIPVEEFDARLHREILNDAVMYLVWHQMFAFATRAIIDAYQSHKEFAPDSGIGKLSDKDFSDHHKTRLVWACDLLLPHMAWMEQRLREIHIKLTGSEPPEDLTAWFIDVESGKIVPITPSTIVRQLGERFPFEANIPRKIMRHLVRAGGVDLEHTGLSHEQAEVYMGHWWQAREPWSPFSGFDWPRYIEQLKELIPKILEDLGFAWIPEGAHHGLIQ